MKGQALKLNDMRSGDVLLLETLSGGFHPFIGLGQSIMTHRMNASANVTHAGLYDGGGNIMEASGDFGLQSVRISGKKSGSKYQVYRVNNKSTAMCAVSWAAKLILAKSSKFGTYSKKGALKSIFTRGNRGTGSQKSFDIIKNDPFKDRSFYCSNFVVECYELAKEVSGFNDVLIKADYRKVSPKMLQSELRNDSRWTYVGNYTV